MLIVMFTYVVYLESSEINNLVDKNIRGIFYVLLQVWGPVPTVRFGEEWVPRRCFL